VEQDGQQWVKRISTASKIEMDVLIDLAIIVGALITGALIGYIVEMMCGGCRG